VRYQKLANWVNGVLKDAEEGAGKGAGAGTGVGGKAAAGALGKIEL
jgi:hypothetical protein